MNKIALVGKTLDELKAIISELGMPGFTAKQVSEWIYKKRAFSIDEMSNISAKNREVLKEQYEVGRTLPVQTVESTDGTKNTCSRLKVDILLKPFIFPKKTVLRFVCLHRLDVRWVVCSV